MTSQKRIFLIGPGLVGADLLDLLLDDGYAVTTLVRRPQHAEQIATHYPGAKVVMGTLDDRELIRQHTADVPIVIHAATADHLPSVEAVITGIEDRAKRGESTIYIHTSGTSELVDNSKGMYASEQVYTDKDPAYIDSHVPDTAPHRAIDLAILKARKELGTQAKIVIVLPPLIYGIGKKIRRTTIQLPTMTRFALKHGYAPVIGKGLSIRCTVHVQDLVRGYMLILHWLESADAAAVLENAYFFTADAAHEMAWGDAARTIGKALHAAGRIPSPEPQNPPKELYDDLFGPYTPTTVGANSRSRGERLHDLGWKQTEKSVLASLVEDEIPLILKETGEFHGYEGVASSGTHVLESLND